jgi:lipopolysaccharide/colanic/teichoic acid biosynthesis glycosyltransferase
MERLCSQALHRLCICRLRDFAFLAFADARCPAGSLQVSRAGDFSPKARWTQWRAIYRAEDGPSVTKSGDPRVTRFGGFLRKYKLDELPQLVNVLRGDMSLIGPRPKLPHHEMMVNMPFRPGLTGAATLAFRCEEEMLQDIPEEELEAYNRRMINPLKAKIDWDYMSESTLLSDFEMLYRTAVCCFSSRSNSWAIDFSKLS